MSAYMSGSIQSSGSTMEIHVPVASAMAAVASCAVALILLIDNFDARVVAGKAVDGRQRVIGAAIIEQDYLQVLVRLPNDAVETLFCLQRALMPLTPPPGLRIAKKRKILILLPFPTKLRMERTLLFPPWAQHSKLAELLPIMAAMCKRGTTTNRCATLSH